MTPRPLSASALPASNCGLTSATILPSGFNKAMAAGKIFCSEMNEQSITAKIGGRKRLGKLRGGQMAGVGLFHDDDAVVLAQFPCELALPDIHGKNLGARRVAAGNR